MVVVGIIVKINCKTRKNNYMQLYNQQTWGCANRLVMMWFGTPSAKMIPPRKILKNILARNLTWLRTVHCSLVSKMRIGSNTLWGASHKPCGTPLKETRIELRDIGKWLEPIQNWSEDTSCRFLNAIALQVQKASMSKRKTQEKISQNSYHLKPFWNPFRSPSETRWCYSVPSHHPMASVCFHDSELAHPIFSETLYASCL